ATVPPNIVGVRLEILVAGRSFNQNFAALPNQNYTFQWDGLDVYGRRLQGKQPTTVRLGYVYRAFYLSPAVLKRSFGYLGSNFTANGNFASIGNFASNKTSHRNAIAVAASLTFTF